VTAGIAGWRPEEVLAHAVTAARMGEHRGAAPADVPVAERIAAAIVRGRGADVTSAASRRDLLDVITREIGSSLATEESVPAAFAIASAAWADPWLACRLAASVGGDTDTIAAMTGSILGAVHGPAGFPSAATAEMLAINPGLDLSLLARDLLALRRH
jgi:ADP-ribosylglycohydrolase